MTDGRVKDRLKSLKVKPDKNRGQNFIIDPSIVEMIVQFGRPSSDERLVEIGPGLGALTGELASIGDLSVIEIESEFCEKLRKSYPKMTIVESDICLYDLSELGNDLVIFGNLPYSRSTDILFHLVAFAPHIKRAVLMLQKEFAERIAGKPGTKSYSVLSVNVQMWAKPKLGDVIPGSAFHPPTKVDSQLIELQFYSEPVIAVRDSFIFKRVVAAAFFRRRKKILNSMNASSFFPEIDLEAIFERLELDSDRRAETFTIEEFGRLADCVAESL